MPTPTTNSDKEIINRLALRLSRLNVKKCSRETIREYFDDAIDELERLEEELIRQEGLAA